MSDPMDAAVGQAAQVLDDKGAHCGNCGREPGDPLSECPDCERFIVGCARALAAAGLLAPGPLREEWGTRFDADRGRIVAGKDAPYPFFWDGTRPPGKNVRRYVTDWLPEADQ